MKQGGKLLDHKITKRSIDGNDWLYQTKIYIDIPHIDYQDNYQSLPPF